MIPKAQSMKENIHKLDFTQIENFCAMRAPGKRMKRQGTDRENIFATYI